jgi:hypothetical protein
MKHSIGERRPLAGAERAAHIKADATSDWHATA